MEESLNKPKYPVCGFEFILDTVEREVDPILPFIKKGMPRVKGFLYVF